MIKAYRDSFYPGECTPYTSSQMIPLDVNAFNALCEFYRAFNLQPCMQGRVEFHYKDLPARGHVVDYINVLDENSDLVEQIIFIYERGENDDDC